MPRLVTGMMAAASAIALAACGGGSDHETILNNQAAAEFVPPATRTAAPLPGQANRTPLTAYVGRYPHDVVGGVDFYDRTEVAAALDTAVGDQKVRHAIVSRTGPETPIFRDDDMLGAWGCERENCGDHNWTLFVPLAGDKPRACYHDAATMRGSHWYAGGAPVTKAGSCPSEPAS